MLGQAGPDTFCYYWSLGGSFVSKLVHTLASGIDVSPTFINFGLFSRPYGLIREYINVI